MTDALVQFLPLAVCIAIGLPIWWRRRVRNRRRDKLIAAIAKKLGVE